MKNITRCENCPFLNRNGEYGDNCNHPISPKENELQFHIEIEKLSTDETAWGFYHSETHVIPKFCPLRKIPLIDIGLKMSIVLDNRLFEENLIN